MLLHLLLRGGGTGREVPPPRILHHTVPTAFIVVAVKASLSCFVVKVSAKALAT